MEYESQILPLDHKGNILLVENYCRHEVGVDELIETDHAYGT